MRTVPFNRSETDLLFFVSASLNDRTPMFANERAAQIALDSLQFFRRTKEIALYGYVIMPDHIHLIVKPLAPLTLSKFMRRFKTFIAHSLDRGSI